MDLVTFKHSTTWFLIFLSPIFLLIIFFPHPLDCKCPPFSFLLIPLISFFPLPSFHPFFFLSSSLVLQSITIWDMSPPPPPLSGFPHHTHLCTYSPPTFPHLFLFYLSHVYFGGIVYHVALFLEPNLFYLCEDGGEQQGNGHYHHHYVFGCI